MNKEILKNYEPCTQKVVENFLQIAKIPHPSTKEEKLARFLAKWFKAHGAKNVYVDELWNVYVKKPATKGFESAPVVCLQSHIDMVGLVADGSKIDIEKHPIEVYEKDGWLHAKDTTLGADNGVGVAMMMYIFENKDLQHGPLEFLMTSQEEIGIIGAAKLPNDALDADYLINIDNEVDNEIVIGCVGCTKFFGSYNYNEATYSASEYQECELNISKMRTYHSGANIHEKKVNAIKLLFDTLSRVKNEYKVILREVNGGTVPNAIPGSVSSRFYVRKQDAIRVKGIIEKNWRNIMNEYQLGKADGKLEFKYKKPSKSKFNAMTVEDSNKVIALYNASYNGLHTFNWDLVVSESSTNIGVIRTFKDKKMIEGIWYTRSPYDHADMRIDIQLKDIFTLAGGKGVIERASPGWLPNQKDPTLINLLKESFKEECNIDPKVTVSPGGLEPGVLLIKNPNIKSAVAFGPNIIWAHSINEKAEIKSIERCTKILINILNKLTKA